MRALSDHRSTDPHVLVGEDCKRFDQDIYTLVGDESSDESDVAIARYAWEETEHRVVIRIRDYEPSQR